MISRKPLQILVLSAAATLLSAPAFATATETFPSGKSWYGVPNGAELASRVVDVKSTKAINVKCGETITFRSGDKTFTWRFDVMQHRSVDLRKVAPAGFMSEQLMVYVSSNSYERS